MNEIRQEPARHFPPADTEPTTSTPRPPSRSSSKGGNEERRGSVLKTGDIPVGDSLRYYTSLLYAVVSLLLLLGERFITKHSMHRLFQHSLCPIKLGHYTIPPPFTLNDSIYITLSAVVSGPCHLLNGSTRFVLRRNKENNAL